MTTLPLCLSLFVVAGCSRPTRETTGQVPAVVTGAVEGREYPVGRACESPGALDKEGRTLRPVAGWRTISSAKQSITLRAPNEGLVGVVDTHAGLKLTFAEKARTLGPDGIDRSFAIVVRRALQAIDTILADTGDGALLSKVYLEEAFPKRTRASFVTHADEPFGSGSSVRTKLAGRTAYVWITGVEGYNTDYVLIEAGARETVFVAAEWNAAIMSGQPECWQRSVIGGVVGSITLTGAAPK